jgi:hypothetical protein
MNHYDGQIISVAFCPGDDADFRAGERVPTRPVRVKKHFYGPTTFEPVREPWRGLIAPPGVLSI